MQTVLAALESLECRRLMAVDFRSGVVQPAPRLATVRPIATAIAPPKVSSAATTGTYAGRVYFDNDSTGAYDHTDQPQAGVTVYDDLNNSGTLDAGEPTAQTDTNGLYSLTLSSGQYLNLRISGLDAVQTTPVIYGTVGGGSFAGDLGFFPTTFNSSSTWSIPTRFTLRAAGTNGDRISILLGNPSAPTRTYLSPARLITKLTFNGNIGDDTFDLDLSGGSPFTQTELYFTGGSHAHDDQVLVHAAAAGSTATFVDNAGIVAGMFVVHYQSAETSVFFGGAGNDVMKLQNATGAVLPLPGFDAGGGVNQVSADLGTYSVIQNLGGGGANVSVALTGSGAFRFGALQQTLSNLSISGSGTTSIVDQGNVLRLGGLTIDSSDGARLDIGNRAIILDYTGLSPAATIAGYLKTGYNNGLWNGRGIRSLFAGQNASKSYTLGAAEASVALGLSGNATSTFYDLPVDSTTLLIRYTRYGDADLSGRVNFNDFLLLQNNYNTATNSFAQGNFNYDGVTDFNDFLVLQNNYGRDAYS